jgi:hypothetical protein
MRLASPALGIALALVPFTGVAASCPLDGPAATQLGPGRPGLVRLQTVAPSDANEYLEHCDGTFENGVCWRSGGTADPYYGAFAERFDGPAHVVGMRVYLSTLYPPPYERTSDLYVWGDGVNGPGAVLAVVRDVGFDAIPLWPDVGAFDFPIYAETGTAFYVGSQANFGPDPNPCWYYSAADCDGPQGSPWTCINPGQGYPSGWQDPGVVWGPITAMGYGVYTMDSAQGIEEAPAAEPAPSWGAVKSLFRP